MPRDEEGQDRALRLEEAQGRPRAPGGVDGAGSHQRTRARGGGANGAGATSFIGRPVYRRSGGNSR